MPWHCWNAFENMPWSKQRSRVSFSPCFELRLRKHSWEMAGWSVAPWGQGTWEADVNVVVLDDGGLKRAFLDALSLMFAGWQSLPCLGKTGYSVFEHVLWKWRMKVNHYVQTTWELVDSDIQWFPCNRCQFTPLCVNTVLPYGKLCHSTTFSRVYLCFP